MLGLRYLTIHSDLCADSLAGVVRPLAYVELIHGVAPLHEDASTLGFETLQRALTVCGGKDRAQKTVCDDSIGKRVVLRDDIRKLDDS